MMSVNKMLVILSLVAISLLQAHDLKVTIKNNEHIRVKGRLLLVNKKQDMTYNAQFILAGGDQELSTLEKVEHGDVLNIEIGGIEYSFKVSSYAPMHFNFSYRYGLQLLPVSSKR
jgi:hypothetical protein